MGLGGVLILRFCFSYNSISVQLTVYFRGFEDLFIDAGERFFYTIPMDGTKEGGADDVEGTYISAAYCKQDA